MARNLALFTGAGFSKWTAGLPLARDLFDFNLTTDLDRVTEDSRLRCLKELKRDWDADHPSGHAEQFISDGLADSYPGKIASRRYNRDHEKIPKDLTWYIARRLTDPFMQYVTPNRTYDFRSLERYPRQTPPFDEPTRFIFPGIQKSKDFFDSIDVDKILGIITTNYDTLIEYALGCDGFNYGRRGEELYGFRQLHPESYADNVPVLNGEIPLAKIHGSISWTREKKYADVRSGLSGKAFIIPPAENKDAYYEDVKEIWELAGEILEPAIALIVFGFSFNPLDKAVIDLLRSSNPEEVLLINPSPPLESAQTIWPDANIEVCRPTNHPNGKPQKWVRVLP